VVLLVEDDEPIIRVLTIHLKKQGLDVKVAKTKQQALDHLKTTPHIHAILMDGWLGGEHTDTCDLIRTIRHTYTYDGHIIAMSSCPNTRMQQQIAGCSLAAASKLDVPRLVKQLTSTRLPRSHT